VYRNVWYCQSTALNFSRSLKPAVPKKIFLSGNQRFIKSLFETNQLIIKRKNTYAKLTLPQFIVACRSWTTQINSEKGKKSCK
jgi:hypothetical protein